MDGYLFYELAYSTSCCVRTSRYPPSSTRLGIRLHLYPLSSTKGSKRMETTINCKRPLWSRSQQSPFAIRTLLDIPVERWDPPTVAVAFPQSSIGILV
jgi:hypothetical protein